MSVLSVVVLHPELAARDQVAWAFTDEEDAVALADFLNARLGNGDEIAWVEFAPVSRKLSKRVLEYVDGWAELAQESLADEDDLH